MTIPSRVRTAVFLVMVILALGLPIKGEESPSLRTEAPTVADAPPIYCPICGAQNKAGSRFCLKDGAALHTLDASRFVRNFVRATETYSGEEIQAAVQEAARSVVRIRVKTNTSLKRPALLKDGVGYLAVLKEETSLAGSGFLIDSSGTVVTNAHVAAPYGNAAEITIETIEGESFPAKVVGVDGTCDLAVLKMEGGHVPALSWGDSERVQLGEEVWALGNPLNIGLSLTRGNISSVVRAPVGMNQVESFLHTDAFSTHGNSGGPLVSVQGLVLGVSDMGYSGFKAQGYSIPSSMARLVVERLLVAGSYKRGFIGLQVHPLDTESAKKYSIKRSRGTVVEWVLPGSPAEFAGFKPGDVLFGIDGHAASETYLFQEAISSVGPGASLKILLEREGQTLSVPVTTALRPEAPRIDPVRDLERYLQAEFVEDSKSNGVVLRITDRFSLARARGFENGDRVTSVLAAQDWPEIPLYEETYRSAHPRPVSTLQELRNGLQGMYLGGRIGVAMSLKSDGKRVNWMVEDEDWAIIL